MTKTYTVTYLGKKGKGDHNQLPIQGIYPPFRVGVPEAFDDARFRSLGVDPAKGKDFITGPQGFVTLANANRPKGHELFKVTVSDSDDKPKTEKPKTKTPTSTPPAKK